LPRIANTAFPSCVKTNVAIYDVAEPINPTMELQAVGNFKYMGIAATAQQNPSSMRKTIQPRFSLAQELLMTGKIEIVMPKIVEILPWMRNQKSASLLLPGSFADAANPRVPNRVASMKNRNTIDVRVMAYWFYQHRFHDNRSMSRT
jgi:hypothetical protein